MPNIESTSRVAPCSAGMINPLSGCFKVVGFGVHIPCERNPEKPSTLKHPLSGFCFWCRVFPARGCGTSVALRYSYPLHEQAIGETVGELPEPSGRPKGCKSGIAQCEGMAPKSTRRKRYFRGYLYGKGCALLRNSPKSIKDLSNADNRSAV